MNKQELMNILPHRDDMMLVDEAYVEDGMSHGKYYVTGEEFFLRGHFPGNPVVPGVILCEMLAQSSCVLFEDEMKDGLTPFFSSLNKVKFKNPVRPGDTFETECEVVNKKAPFYFVKGKGYVNGKLSVTAEFSYALVPGDK